MTSHKHEDSSQQAEATAKNQSDNPVHVQDVHRQTTPGSK